MFFFLAGFFLFLSVIFLMSFARYRELVDHRANNDSALLAILATVGCAISELPELFLALFKKKWLRMDVKQKTMWMESKAFICLVIAFVMFCLGLVP